VFLGKVPAVQRRHVAKRKGIGVAADRAPRYAGILELQQRTNYYDPLPSLAARTMSLKIYYEIGEFDLPDSHLEALKKITSGGKRRSATLLTEREWLLEQLAGKRK